METNVLEPNYPCFYIVREKHYLETAHYIETTKFYDMYVHSTRYNNIIECRKYNTKMR